MSEIPPSGASAIKPQAYQDAVQRAKQIASKIKNVEGVTNALPSGLKRPLCDTLSGPESKKAAGTMMQPALDGGMVTSEIMMVPDKMVGLIIGRGGEQITRLQGETGCKIQMAQDSGGLSERQCTLTGASSAISNAKAAIERIIANEGNGPSRGGGPPGMGAAAPGGALGGSGFYEMIVPGHKVGLIIGKGGDTIKQLQESTGAKIVIIQDSAEVAHEKPLRITGPPDSVERAKNMVNDILTQNDERDSMNFAGGAASGRGRGRGGGRGGAAVAVGGLTRGASFAGRGGRGRGSFVGGGHWGAGQPPQAGSEYGGQHTDYVTIPANKCGLVIGKGGETIKNINQTSGAHCEVDKNAPPDAREKNFIIRGSPESVERAKAMILEKLGMPSNSSNSYGNSSGGSYSGSWGGQYQNAGGYPQDSSGVPVNPQTGQPDYSAQWIEYYRSMGMTREAEAIEQQLRASQAGPTSAAPAANGAPNGPVDYSAQWAEYYRSIGKYKEAEAIEAQMKQKAIGSQPYSASAAATGGYGNYYGGQAQSATSNTSYGYPSYPYSGQPTGAES